MDTDQRILEQFIRSHIGDALPIIENLEDVDRAAFLQSISVDVAAQVLNQMDRFKASSSLDNVAPTTAARFIEKMSPSIAAMLLRLKNEEQINALLGATSSQTAITIKRMLNYPFNSVGAHFDPGILTLPESLIVAQALTKIIEHHPLVMSYLPILGRDQLLVGSLELKELLAADDKVQVGTVMNSAPHKVLADMNISTLLKGWRVPHQSLPVVDDQGIFLGVIARETLLKLDHQEKEQDHLVKDASTALGDLYAIGFTSLFQSFTGINWKS